MGNGGHYCCESYYNLKPNEKNMTPNNSNNNNNIE